MTACHGNHPSFEEEDSGDLLVAGSQVAQRGHVFLLVDDEHGERPDDVEACHDEDEREEDVCEVFLYPHDFVCVGLLLIPVLHAVFVAGNLFHLPLHAVEVRARLQAQFQG